MNPERWHQVEQIYNSVLECNREERAAFLEKACAGDEALRKEVESLLACNSEAAAFIESPAMEAAAKALAGDSEHRTSLVGRTLLHYSLREQIGEGGMGVVYRAHDSHLNRDVAIKVLPDIFAQDPQRLARFEREARAVAALSHPNILGIFDLCGADGVTFAAMELLEGGTLRASLDEGAPPVRKALDYAMQMAQGLAAAHERGIVHRDLKPENVFITKEGRVKILDFGLAKLRRDTGSAAETSTALTSPGVLMGTVGYMSPEQVRGQDPDARSDIFALGAILYEILSGQRAFRGDSEADTISAILKEDPPDFTHLQKRGSPAIERVVRRCLEKNPGERFQSARDLSFALEAVGSDSGTPAPAGKLETTVPWRPGWWAIAAVAMLGVLAAFGVWLWTSRSPSNPAVVTRLTANFGSEVLATDLWYQVFAISPDGSILAYIANEAGTRRLYLRSLASFAGRAVPGTEGARGPFFSPDGVWVGFGAKGKLYKLPVAEGPPVELCDTKTLWGGSWGEDGKIVFADGVGLHRVSATGGAPELIARSEGNEEFWWPEILPDGAHALVSVHDGIGPFQIDLFKLSDGSRRKVISERGFPRYLATGHIASASQGQLRIVPFDPARLTVTGLPSPVLEGVGDFAVSRSGTLCYAPGRATQRTLAWLDGRGGVTPLPVPAQGYHQPALAPDGRRIAVTVGEPGDIWIYSLDGDVFTPLTFDNNGFWPIWTPDGRQVIYASGRGTEMTLVRKNADGTGESERLVSGEYFYSPISCSPNGRLLVFDRYSNDTAETWILPLVGERRAEPLLATANNSEGNGIVSPDGRWIAYWSDESGRAEIYVQGFRRSSGKWQVSTEGAREPLWSRDGRELFYRTTEGHLKVVPVTLGPVFSRGKVRPVYSGPFRTGGRTNYDITPKGDRFLIVTDHETAPIKQLHVVLNWFTELKAHLRARN